MVNPPISWGPVHAFVGRLLAGRAATAIIAGTPEWCALADDDPQKVAAVLTAASRWALEQELLDLHRQRAAKDAAVEISKSKSWSSVARRLRDRAEFFNTHPDLRRRAS